MISVMKTDCELDSKPDSIVGEGPEDVKGKIWEGGGDDDGSNNERVSNSRVSEEARVSEMELDSRAPEAEVRPRVPVAEESTEVRVKHEEPKESDGGGVPEKIETKNLEIKVESSSAEEGPEYEEEGDEGEAEKSTVSQYSSLLSEFDDFVANEKRDQRATSRALRYGLEVGDMVWGKVKSHPWWPGHIFNDAFATPQVRRTRREGHVLVAFFGDSSYGWFDPAELIPFEANFAEKSQQTVSRTFAKAVEEAVDEMSRRRSLGLACRCRSPYSFRPTSVQGYFVVDVPDEPRAVYSAAQIQKGRDSFKPSETLAFIKQLALSPCIGDENDLEFVKNRAEVVAYRKAVFEEFDETYAQAFGVQPGRPARDRNDLKDQPGKQPPRAPLSGPLVIAETLGGDTSATKHTKVKDNSKKDRYLLKRRDESRNLKAHQSSQGQVNSSSPSASVDGSVVAGDGNFVLQKRTSAAPLKTQNGADSSSNGKEAAASRSCLTEDVSENAKPSLDKSNGALEEVKEESGSSPADISGNVDGSSQSLKHDNKVLAEFQQPHMASTVISDENCGADQAQDGSSVGGPSPADPKCSSGISTVSGVKKAKVKRPREEPKSENPMMEGKKRKKKNQLGTETSFRDPQKQTSSKKVGSSTGKPGGKKAIRTGLAPKEELKADQSKRNTAYGNNSSDTVGTSPFAVVGNTELELPRLLSDLQVLALDPFHGIERSIPAMVRRFFLRFRSLVYQKSLVLSPPSETESTEARTSKTSAGAGASENNSAEPGRDIPSSKPPKPSFRSEDPTIAGRKRAPSDRQEENAAKRSKKVNDIRTMAAEKKAIQKTLEPQRMGEARDSAVPLGRKNKPDSAKKLESPARSVEPTMLVMKFPPKTSLPSPAELKARLARFGQMDQSALRVFWKSSTCRVVFLHKSEAQAACNYAASNSSLFGTPGIRCYIKELGASGSEVPEPGKIQGTDENPIDNPRIKDSSVSQRPTSSTMPSQPSVQLKSCLKKATPNGSGTQASGPGTSNNRGTPSVKFMLAGEESATTSRVEPSIVGNRNNPNNNNNNNNSASFGDGGALVPSSSTSVAMDFTVGNVEKVIPQNPLPILSLPQYAKNPLSNNNSHHHHHHHHHNQRPDVMMGGPRNTNNPNASNFSSSAPPSSSNGVDISQQMLSLLTRCNDVVTNVTGLLGYVPYHPL